MSENSSNIIRVAELPELSNAQCRVYRMSDNTQQAVFTTADPYAVAPLSTELDISAPSLTSYSWCNGTIQASTAENTVGMTSAGTTLAANRMFLGFSMPSLPCNPRIKKVELRLYQTTSSIVSEEAPRIGVFTASGDLSSAPTVLDLIDYERVRLTTSDSEPIVYTFDITKLFDAVNKGESTEAKVVLQLLDESVTVADNITLAGTSASENRPEILVSYEPSYAVNVGYRAHTLDLEYFGQGSVDLATGNLMIESPDFSWEGNRQPVTIKHLYNSALSGYAYTANPSIGLHTADFSAMHIGYGWKLNVMQSMVAIDFVHAGTAYSGYVYIGENGDATYFKPVENSTQFEDVDGLDLLYDPETLTLTQGDETYLFANGRLVKITDAHNNCTEIIYTDGKLTAVTDSVGRTFTFAYDSNGFLTTITAPDNSVHTFYYSGENLLGKSMPGNRNAQFGYNSSNNIGAFYLYDSTGYRKRMWLSCVNNRYVSIADNDAETVDSTTTYHEAPRVAFNYSAASRRTIVTLSDPIDVDEGETTRATTQTVYTFNNDGEVISEYLSTAETGNDLVNDENGNITHSIHNLLLNHNFSDTSLRYWTKTNSSLALSQVSAGRINKYALSLRSTDSAITSDGVQQQTITLSAGDYTLSAYARVINAFTATSNPGFYLRVTDTDGNVITESERYKHTSGEYIRLIAPFTLASEQAVIVQILVCGSGLVFVDAAQLEDNAFANDYNMLINGNSELQIGHTSTIGWTGCGYSAAEQFSENYSMILSSTPDTAASAVQRINVRSDRSSRETFTLSGWAKAIALPDREREEEQTPLFRLKAIIRYKDLEPDIFCAEFSPCTEEWQFSSVQFSKTKFAPIEYMQAFCEYSFNNGTAYFDDVQLVQDAVEYDLTADDFYVEAESEDATDTDTVTEDDDLAPAFEELLDSFGNTLTETTFTDGEFGTVYRSFAYSENGNDLIEETDARGNKTTYTVDSVTSRPQQITDRCGNKTAYEYDSNGRTTKVSSKDAANTELANVSYTYDAFDKLTEITRGDGMKYSLLYNPYHELASIGVDGMESPLVAYNYKQGTGRLKQITYANGDTMKATYNSLGQLVTEKWYNASDTLVAHYRYTYDSNGNIVRSLDILLHVEYTYVYENGLLMRTEENGVSVDDNSNVSSRASRFSVLYKYDNDGQLIRKRYVNDAGTVVKTVYYETTEDGSLIVKNGSMLSHSKTDAFGRKVFDELQLGGGCLSRQFDYVTGAVTDQHADSKKIKSSPTTHLVERIVFADGRTLSYEYDAEERITKVTDSEQGVTTYEYDALGQLVREIRDGAVVNAMTYDAYGNILTKNGVTYTYDTVWKDRLASVGDQTITYDAQGNPTTYKGSTLTWEKGRQLASYGNNFYQYNANGIRTAKYANGVYHSYVLDGTRILREKRGSTLIYPLYDNEDEVCGITYGYYGTFYFQKNLQGDVIGITNANGELVAEYAYDAWGACTILSDTSGRNIATLNPFRYRGYYYDTETGLYYLQSRYYDPEVGRFLNSDDSEYAINQDGSTTHDLFTYCSNDPINYVDPLGNIALITCVVIGAIAGLILGGATGACISYAKYKKVKWKYVLIGAGVGAAIGAAAGYAIGIAIGASSTTIFAAKGFSKSFKITAKISKQMSHRGWSKSLIKDTILKNVGRKAVNKATGNAATAYFTSTGAYVVIDNITKEIIQISDRFDPNWVVDFTIKLLKSDVFVR